MDGIFHASFVSARMHWAMSRLANSETLTPEQRERARAAAESDRRNFAAGHGVVAEAVKGVSFDVPENTTVALVGESGSGKSVTAMSVLNLLPDNAVRTGAIRWQGRDLLRAGLRELQAMRGKEIACVFQDPMSSLNPVFTVGDQLVEPLTKHLKLGRAAALERAEELLAEVGIPDPKRRLASHPHEMSGGQQ
ncbi:ATP-binding cassette domain-containing protein, partial [Bradyrhizobium sp. NBAIM08]|uniref:ATP-binding cassette domain-containing protein n=1 Tax=Bradyrhizobium sp. NBAIM08 TaxID=2793815 RepID=UPI0023EF2122